MKLLFLTAVLSISTVFCFAQKPSTSPELTEKEIEAAVKKAFEEQDRILSKPQVIYYAPVISPSGEEIAFVKRTLEYRLKGGGGIPFLSDSPEVTWISDKVEVVRRNLVNQTESVVFERTLPEPRPGVVIFGISAYLDWKEKLLYKITLHGYEINEIPEGRYGFSSGVSIGTLSLEKQGAASARGISVRLDPDAGGFRYPIGNQIIISCYQKVVPCPTF